MWDNMAEEAPFFLGLDASTQALKASLLTSTLDVRRELAINFDADLPHYKTKGGVHHGPDGQVHSPVEMVIEAFDLLFGRMKDAGWPLGDVAGIAAAGQQHASVYWNKDASQVLSSVSPTKPLLQQMKGAFSRQVIPNWQDSSTTAECREIESAVGGADALAKLTGSKAHERFTGPQIMRWRRAHPDQWAETSRISLVSSYITTLLCLDGEIKGIDESDVCGMNLWTMNTKERGWNEQVMQAIAGDEADKLAAMLGDVERDGGKPAGKIGKWFAERFGFNPDCLVFPGTGDNPATFLSLTLRPSEGLISLGTSDVVLVSTKNYAPDKEYHAFFHPAQIPPDQGGHDFRYFNMLVYKNGSLAREYVRDQYFDKSWDKFNEAVSARRPKSASDQPEQAGFYWLLPDIIPDNAYGQHKYLSSPSASSSSVQKVDEFSDPASNALSILEAQFLSYAWRTGSILESATTRSYSSLPRLSRVYATGGASANGTILSLASDIFGAEICKNVEYEPETGWVGANWNACSVGMAYKARWGYERATQPGRELVEFDQIISECRDARTALRKETQGKSLLLDADVEEGVRIVARPGAASEAYAKCMDWWSELEQRAVEEGRGLKVNGSKVNGSK